MPTKEEILKLLDKLDDHVADDLESEELEFKPWNSDIKVNRRFAQEYAVCFANSKGGVLVFGIEDRLRGREKAIRGCKGYDINTLCSQIYQGTMPNIRVHIEELSLPEGTLLLMHVPAGNPDTTYATSEGLHKIRVEKNCLPLLQSNHRRQRMSIGAIDWSAEPAAGITLNDLDPLEIERFRNTLRSQKPTSELLNLSNEELLRAVKAVEGTNVVNAGVLMFGRKDVLKRIIPQHEVIFVAHTSPTEIFKENYSNPILATLERMTEILLLPIYNSTRSFEVDIFKFDVQKFPTITLREALLNAIVHRDYAQIGQVYVRLENDELTFSDPGGFIGGITVDNILSHEARQRNKRLAEIIEKSGLVERAGVGRRRIFLPMLAFGKRMPLYRSDLHSVTLKLLGGVVNDNVALYVARKQQEGVEFDLIDLILLNYLVVYDSIDVNEASRLCQRDYDEMKILLDDRTQAHRRLLEKRGKRASTYHLDRLVGVELLGKAKYSQLKDIDAVRFPEMIRQYVSTHGSITNKECRELLRLGDSGAAAVKASEILKSLLGEDGFLILDPQSKPGYRNRRYLLRPGFVKN